MSVLYGSGALLVREACVRWGAGWPDLGVLGSYGRLAGVNWVWSLELTIYHCLFSICIPIVLTELAFPKWRDRL